MYKEYYPLPKYLIIKESQIHGLGLFTTEKIDKGVNLGKSHYATESEIIRTPLGGFPNHSDDPNIKIKTTNDFRLGDTQWFSNNSKVRSLGFVPRVPLKTGINKTIHWLANKNL